MMLESIPKALGLLSRALSAAIVGDTERALGSIKGAAATLLRLIPADKPLGTELFNALAQLTITFAFEMVIVRDGENGPEVYVAQRGADEAYPGMWHVPGTALRPGEIFAQAISRLCAREGLHINQRPQELRVIGMLNNRGEERGHFVSFVIIAKSLGDEMIGGKWISTYEKDETIVPHHRLDILPRSITAWLERENLPKLETFVHEDFHIE